MTKRYPRHYLVIHEGKVEKVKVKDRIHEMATIIKHPEAIGTNKPDKFDDSRFVIEDK